MGLRNFLTNIMGQNKKEKTKKNGKRMQIRSYKYIYNIYMYTCVYIYIYIYTYNLKKRKEYIKENLKQAKILKQVKCSMLLPFLPPN